MTEKFHAVANTSDVPDGRPLAVVVGTLKIALCRVNGTYFAIENVCSHDNGVLAGGATEEYQGALEGHEIECPRHGARFDVRDGSVLSMPAVYPVASFKTKVEDDTIFVKVDVDE